MTLTMESFNEAIRLVKNLGPVIPEVRIVFDHYALKDTDVRLFPASRHRSRRIHKKLVKRHGGEFRKQPCMWQLGDTIIAHPSYRAQLEAVIRPAEPPAYRNPILGRV
jgi:hypothetical protein